jgi:hypothetical protein
MKVINKINKRLHLFIYYYLIRGNWIFLLFKEDLMCDNGYYMPKNI